MAPAAVRTWRIPVEGQQLVVAASGWHRVSFNFGPEVRFESDMPGRHELVPFRRNGVLFLPAPLAPRVRWPAGREGGPRARKAHPLSQQLFVEMAPRLFDAAAAALGWPEARMRGMGPLTLVLDPTGQRLAQALAGALSQRPAAPAALLDPLAQAVAGWILSHHHESPVLPPHGQPRPGLERAIAHIEQAAEQALSLQTLADAAGMSRHHFARCFKAGTGLSPYQYLLQARLRRARRLMEQALQAGREVRVGEVAVDAGFATHSQFSAHFKRACGLSPAEWLTQQRAASKN